MNGSPRAALTATVELAKKRPRGKPGPVPDNSGHPGKSAATWLNFRLF